MSSLERMLQGLSRRQFSVLLAALFILPAAYTFGLVLNSTQSTNSDYFHNIVSIFSEEGRFQWRGLFIPGNEHYIVGAKILYALNVLLFNGRNIPLATMGFVIALTISFVLWLPSRSVLVSRISTATFVFCLSLFVFSTHAVHNFMWGMSGAIWFTSNVFVLLSLVSYSRGRVSLSFLCGIFAAACNGTGLAVFPALLVLEMMTNGAQKRFFGLLVATGLFAILFKSLYRLPSHHVPAYYDPVAVVSFALSYIGGGVSNNLESALFFGLIGVVSFISVVFSLLRARHLEPSSVFYGGVAFFALSASLLTAIARAGFLKPEISLSSRYANIAALFWVSLVFLLLRLRNEVSLATALVTLGLFSFLSGNPDVARYRRLVLPLELHGIALQLDSPPIESFQIVTHNDETRKKLVATYKAIGHYPYVSDFPYACNLLGNMVQATDIRKDSSIFGDILDFSPSASPTLNTVRGWIFAKNRTIECLLMSDAEGLVVGSGIYGQRSVEINPAVGASGQSLGWEGLVRRIPKEEVRVLAKFKNEPGFVEVQASR